MADIVGRIPIDWLQTKNCSKPDGDNLASKIAQSFRFSLGPVEDFVCVSFTPDNLNCFRMN